MLSGASAVKTQPEVTTPGGWNHLEASSLGGVMSDADYCFQLQALQPRACVSVGFLVAGRQEPRNELPKAAREKCWDV